MFTGIISAVGEITNITNIENNNTDVSNNEDSGLRLTIELENFLREDTKIGDSIAIQGACMTVIEMQSHQSENGVNQDRFVVDVSRESLNKTVGLSDLGQVNLEHAMRLGSTIDGHLVSGHVDGVGSVSYFEPVGESWELRINVPKDLAKYLAYKGSITVNGVSLTVNSVQDLNGGACEISINLIPHTIQVTTLKNLKAGSKVNLEIDMLARYVERMLSWQNNNN